MDGRFVKAFTLLPKQRVICGYVTRPLCLRHRLMFHAVKSPFADGKGEITPEAVLITARIMGGKTLEEMTQDPTKQDCAEVARMYDEVDYFMEQSEAIQASIREQAHWPVMWKKSTGGGGDKGVPWVLNVICSLTKGGIPLEDAWTMPESQAVWMNAALAISAGGDVDIVSDSDLAAQRQLDALYARLGAESKDSANV